jgi:Ca-activated chloride channel family protein
LNGQYTIQSKKGETLLFQYIGYKQEKRVVKSSTLDVKMKADELVLEECVVVGYGHELRATKSMLLLIWQYVPHRESCIML